jgi:four helix bundle protein
MSYIVFKELLVWQRAMDMVEEIYKISSLLPKEETFSLISQIRRASVSVPSNIAEGNSRNSTKEYINFLGIARGSNSEVYTQLLICKKLRYLSEEQIKKAIALSEEIGKMLNAMIIKLSNK